MDTGRAARLVRLTSHRGRLVARSIREEGLGFLNLWPRVVPGGVTIFDDYLDSRPGVGVRAAVDELLASGAVEPRLAWARWLCWTTRRADGR